MTERLEVQDTLSRSSDHLGVLANILKDLGGGATLLNELVQNADDAGANKVRFTATAEELVVWNSGEFTDCGYQHALVCPMKVNGGRACDLHSFRMVGGRPKADEPDLTGAFGVGFTSVYQVTDHPELIAGGHHLVLDESAPEADRIRICHGGCSRDHHTPATTFYLPWATDDSALRQALSVDALSGDAVESLVSDLHDAAVPAAIFLKNVCEIVVSGASRLPTSVKRNWSGDRIQIDVDGKRHEWAVIQGDASDARALRASYDSISADRSVLVTVALPVAPDGLIGRVYAGLPTEARTGWIAHIDGSFYPRQDRKGIEFDGATFRTRWNAMLIEAAAGILAHNLTTIRDELGHDAAWDYLANAELISREIAQDKYPSAFAAFFAKAKETAPSAPITLLADGRSVAPTGCVVGRDEEEYGAAEVLADLGLPLVDASIRANVLRTSQTTYGLRQLSATDVVSLLVRHEITAPWSFPHSVLQDDASVDALLTLLELLSARGGRSDLQRVGADRIAIVPCIDSTYAPAAQAVRLDADDIVLFQLLDPSLKIVDEDKLVGLSPAMIELCDDITPERAVEIFERDADALAMAPLEIVDWLDKHRIALNDEAIQRRVRSLAVFPSASGGFKALDTLSLPSNFTDVIGVANVVDVDRLGRHGDLLRLLQVRELDGAEYLQRHVIPAARASEVAPENLLKVLELIYSERSTLERLQHPLAAVPLVRCTDGRVRAPQEVHLPYHSLALIAPEAPTADVEGLQSHLIDTLVWLGVSDTPSFKVIGEAAVRLAQADNDPSPEVVIAILDAIPSPLPEHLPNTLAPLKSAAWLPVEGGGRTKPADVYAVYQRELFESQGPLLGLSRPVQNQRADALRSLGVQQRPTTAMIIAHLRHCVAHRTVLNDQVYRALGEATKDEGLVRALRSEPCIQVEPGSFESPTRVFWTDPGLGRWA